MAAVCPGDRLGPGEAGGEGTYVDKGYVVASVAGERSVGPDGLWRVLRRGRPAARVPAAGDRVLARVTRVSAKAANCEIVAANGRALAAPLQGVVRLPDVRKTEVDAVEMHRCFRPGDVVRADVLSLGDARSYYLSTAHNELGVVYAKSAAADEPMQPASWEEMVCPVTESREPRKVAKVA